MPTPPPPEIEDLTADLRAASRLFDSPDQIEDILQRSLRSLDALIPYDLAAAFRLEAGRLRVVAAVGPLVRPEVLAHELELQRFPTIRRALETRRPIPLAAHDHDGEGDPYDGVLDLPHGHSCMVVPLFAGEQSLGLVTLDRATCGVYPPPVVELAGVFGQLMSLALVFADQAALLERCRRQLLEQNRLLVEDAGGAHVAIQRLEASRSAAMRETLGMAQRLAGAALPVLIQGETGTGKELLAQAIHAWSPRARGPFVKLNCAAIPEHLIESELFGHVRGAFSGADRDREGRFRTANGGTLLLDEIGDMPLAAQSKLLRVLQEGAFEPVGADRTVRVDVRILAATNVDLRRAVAEGRFREDLYYRLAVLPLQIPPLRERPEDIEAIAQALLAERARRSGRGPWTLSSGAREALKRAPWPGNARQLVNALERATILQPAGEIAEALLAPSAPAPTGQAPDRLLSSFEENERRYLERLMDACGGKLYGPDGAGARSGLKPTTLRSKLVKHGLR